MLPCPNEVSKPIPCLHKYSNNATYSNNERTKKTCYFGVIFSCCDMSQCSAICTDSAYRTQRLQLNSCCCSDNSILQTAYLVDHSACSLFACVCMHFSNIFVNVASVNVNSLEHAILTIETCSE